MLVYSPEHGRFIIDPHYLTIIPFQKVLKTYKDRELGEKYLMWMYHMYNPHSPFRDYRNSTKSLAIVDATFPKDYVDKRTRELTDKAKAALEKALAAENKEVNEAEFKPSVFDPQDEPGMQEAIEWYRQHLKQTPLWYAVESYKEAIYNTAKIISNPTSTAAEIKTANSTLEDLPKQMKKMQEQAEKDEAITLKVQGDRNIKRGERKPEERKSLEHKQSLS